uniref:Uncharacterized protein n=1 Tax=Nelumbo nucifera TaxID=4432 RepID=A0A822XQQ4_NELNU|nr:TPA_asm: hypothetical protein HUJ06_022739 [Nelumbo nucifera]
MQIMKPVETGRVESSESSKEQKSQRNKQCCKSSRKRRGKHQKKNEHNHAKGFSDLCFSLTGVGLHDGIPELQKMEKASEFQRLEKLHQMPPLSDAMAMKKHLKSWAYAVASTIG